MLVFGSSTLKKGGGAHGERSTFNAHMSPHLLREQAAAHKCGIRGSFKNWNFSNISDIR